LFALDNQGTERDPFRLFFKIIATDHIVAKTISGIILKADALNLRFTQEHYGRFYV
jgi:hypothetical protein